MPLFLPKTARDEEKSKNIYGTCESPRSLLVVKGATIWGRYPLFEARFTYLEVRVGNQSVEGSGGEERLCENQV